MTPVVQEIIVYVLFATAVGYFAYRFYAKNVKKKAKTGKACSSGNCGCH